MKRLLATLAFLVLLAAVLLWAAGVFSGEKIEPGRRPLPSGVEAPASTAVAERAQVELFEDAVGTVDSRTRVAVAAQVTGRVLSVAADAGAVVRKGEILVTLDDREPQARLAQARKGLAAADAAEERARQMKAQGEARLAQVEATHRRVQRLIETGAATQEQMDAAESDLLQARAAVFDATAAIAAAEARIQQEQEVVKEAEIALGHSRIASPIDGVVSERNIEPGDLAWPGRALLLVLDPEDLRLVARVREGLIALVRKGATLRVRLPAVDADVAGVVAEIIPSADPQSRTFEVRVDLPAVAGVHPGMFGRLRLPVGTREIVRLPAGAVVRVGQLETVLVESDGAWQRRLVTTGAHLGDHVEVLSGLAGGETVGR